MRLLTITIAALLWAPSPLLADQCDGDGILYVGEPSSGDQGMKTISYFPEGHGANARIVFEGWQRKKRLWRIDAEYACSNGIVFCAVTVPLSNGKNVEASATTIFRQDKVAYLVLSDLEQNSYAAQTKGTGNVRFETSWSGDANSPDGADRPPIILPSVWRADGCANP